jgi:ABC-type uncharacterized transport system ATPase subunit
MELKNPHSAGVNAIRQLKGLGSVTQTGTRLSIEIQAGNEEVRDLIVEVAVNQKMGVLDFSAEKMSLEEIFLQLTTVEKAS